MDNDNIDAHVEAGMDAGMSARKIAAELQVDRGRVDRCIARLKKRQRAAEATEQEQADPSTLEKLIADCDDRIATSIAVGNALEAGRLTRVREGLIAQRPPEVVPEDGADWALLTEAGRSVFDHCIRVAHGEPGNPYWTELLARIPAHVDVVHPAHLPLPDGAPEGERLLVP